MTVDLRCVFDCLQTVKNRLSPLQNLHLISLLFSAMLIDKGDTKGGETTSFGGLVFETAHYAPLSPFSFSSN